jgi:hypothetical protein
VDNSTLETKTKSELLRNRNSLLVCPTQENRKGRLSKPTGPVLLPFLSPYPGNIMSALHSATVAIRKMEALEKIGTIIISYDTVIPRFAHQLSQKVDEAKTLEELKSIELEINLLTNGVESHENA